MSDRHLIDAWHDRFLLELRLREVSGPRIGDLLAEVDAHCADSGEDPQHAFGDPAGYARAVAGQARPTPPWLVGLLALGVVAGVAGVLSGVAALAQGGPAELTAGNLLAVLVAAGGAVLAVTAMRWGTVWCGLAVAAGVTGTALASVLSTRPVAHLPVAAALVLGLAALALSWRLLPDDRVLDPRTGREPFGQSVPLTVVRWAPLVLLAAAVALVVLVPVG